MSELTELRRIANSQECQLDFASALTTWQELAHKAPDDPEVLCAIARIEAYQKLEAHRLAVVNRLLAVGLSLSDTKTLEELMNLILAVSREVTASDAGSIYIVDRSDPQTPVVRFLVAQNDSQPDRTLSDFAVPMDNNSLVGYVAMTGACLNIPDAQQIPPTAPYRHHSTFDQDIDYQTRSVVVVPMQDSRQQIIGVMQLINRKCDANLPFSAENVQPYRDWEVAVVRALADQASIVMERNSIAY
jgi:GAF domain-containing protein